MGGSLEILQEMNSEEFKLGGRESQKKEVTKKMSIEKEGGG